MAIGIITLLFVSCKSTPEEDLGYIDCKWVRIYEGMINNLPLYNVYCVSDCPDGAYDIQKDCNWVHLYKDEERLEYKQSDGIHTRDLDGKNYTYDSK